MTQRFNRTILIILLFQLRERQTVRQTDRPTDIQRDRYIPIDGLTKESYYTDLDLPIWD